MFSRRNKQFVINASIFMLLLLIVSDLLPLLNAAAIQKRENETKSETEVSESDAVILRNDPDIVNNVGDIANSGVANEMPTIEATTKESAESESVKLLNEEKAKSVVVGVGVGVRVNEHSSDNKLIDDVMLKGVNDGKTVQLKSENVEHTTEAVATVAAAEKKNLVEEQDNLVNGITSTTARASDYKRSRALPVTNATDETSSTQSSLVQEVATTMLVKPYQSIEAEEATTTDHINVMTTTPILEPTIQSDNSNSNSSSNSSSNKSGIGHSNENTIDASIEALRPMATNEGDHKMKINNNTEKQRASKFINDNSTNAQQLNSNAAEVWTLVSMMSTIPKIDPSGNVSTVKAEYGNEIERQANNKNQSIAALELNNQSEKNLLDWQQIMLNNNEDELSNQKYETLTQEPKLMMNVHENQTEFIVNSTLDTTDGAVTSTTVVMPKDLISNNIEHLLSTIATTTAKTTADNVPSTTKQLLEKNDLALEVINNITAADALTTTTSLPLLLLQTETDEAITTVASTAIIQNTNASPVKMFENVKNATVVGNDKNTNSHEILTGISLSEAPTMTTAIMEFSVPTTAKVFERGEDSARDNIEKNEIFTTEKALITTTTTTKTLESNLPIKINPSDTIITTTNATGTSQIINNEVNLDKTIGKKFNKSNINKESVINEILANNITESISNIDVPTTTTAALENFKDELTATTTTTTQKPLKQIAVFSATTTEAPHTTTATIKVDTNLNKLTTPTPTTTPTTTHTPQEQSSVTTTEPAVTTVTEVLAVKAKPEQVFTTTSGSLEATTTVTYVLIKAVEQQQAKKFDENSLETNNIGDLLHKQTTPTTTGTTENQLRIPTTTTASKNVLESSHSSNSLPEIGDDDDDVITISTTNAVTTTTAVYQEQPKMLLPKNSETNSMATLLEDTTTASTNRNVKIAMATTTSTTEAPLISLLDDSITSIKTTNTPSAATTTIKPIKYTTARNDQASVTATTVTSGEDSFDYDYSTTTTTSTTAAGVIEEATISLAPITSTTPTDFILNTPNPTVQFPNLSIDNLSHAKTNPGETDVNVIIAITVSTVGVIALILLVAFIYLFRKRQKQMSYGQRCRPVSMDAYSLDNVSVLGSVRRKGAAALRASKRSYGNAAFDDPALRHNILNATELAKFAERRTSIFEEFRDVPQITARADEVPAGCEDKNRYANVIPLPETRVILQQLNDDNKTEYINANYVRGPKDAPNYYIACQAPLKTTVIDFWRMIWEQQSRVIIQATDLIENGKEFCAEYLPPSVTLDNQSTFGDYQITLKNREVKDKYAISIIMLKHLNENVSRELTHYWYKWPEVGVPSEEAPIIAMLLEARSSLKSYAMEQANELKEKSATLTLKCNESNSKAISNERGTKDVQSTSNSEINGNVSTEKLKAAATNQGPLTIHCSPGTGRTGTIIACDMAIRNLETPKRSVDIPQIVYYVRRGRAKAVETKEQYEFIYKVALMYAMKITNLSNDN